MWLFAKCGRQALLIPLALFKREKYLEDSMMTWGPMQMRSIKEMFLDPIMSVKTALEKLSPANRITPEMLALRKTSELDLLFQLWNANGEDLSMFTKGFLSIVGEQSLRRSLEDAFATYGKALEISKATQKNAYFVTTTQFQLTVLLERERAGKIKGLFIRPPLYKVESLMSALH